MVRMWSIGLLVAALPGIAAAADVAGTRAAIDRSLDAQYPHLEALYKDIHSHPELGIQETRTAAKLAEEMRALGFEVTERVGKTGIVAIYKNGPGPTVMVRTELDALPMEEKTGLPYASHVVSRLLRGKPTPVEHCLRPRHPHGGLGRRGPAAARPQGPVARHADVHRPAGRGGAAAAPGACWRTACSRASASPTTASPSTSGRARRHVSYRPGVNNSTSDALEIIFKGTRRARLDAARRPSIR